jgi:hypothetical protein
MPSKFFYSPVFKIIVNLVKELVQAGNSAFGVDVTPVEATRSEDAHRTNGDKRDI